MASSREQEMTARLDAYREKLQAELDKGPTRDKGLVTSYEKRVDDLKDELKHIRAEGLWFPGLLGYAMNPLLNLVGAAGRLALAGLEAKIDKLADGQAALQARMEYPLVQPETTCLIEAATCIIVDLDDHDVPLGLGFFYGPTWGISCYHIFDSKKPETGQRWIYKDFKDGRLHKLELMITVVNQGLDYVCFSTNNVHQYLPLLRDLSSQLKCGREFALCSYQLHLGQNELKKGFGIGLAPYTARAVQVSKRGHFLAYEANCFPGHSDAALLVYDGKVIGMHQEGVNAVVEILDRKEVEDRLDDLETSMLSVARSVGQGGVGC